MNIVGENNTKIQFPNNRDQVLEEVIQSMSLDNPYNEQVMSIVKILLKTIKQRNQLDLNNLENFFQSNYKYMGVLKESLSLENYQQIFNEMKFESIPQCKTIFEAGDPGRKMYFILHGEVGILLPLHNKEEQQKIEQQNLLLNQSKLLYRQLEETKVHDMNSFEYQVSNKYSLFRLVNVLHQGDFFGEVAIYNRILRTGTVLTKTPVLLAVLTFDTYQKYIELTQNQINHDIIAFLTQVSIFKTWTPGGLHIILKNCEEISYKPFEYIFKKGELAKYIYFIRQGEVKLTIYENLTEKNLDFKRLKLVNKINAVVQLTTQQHFGDWELYLNENESIICQKMNLKQQIEKINRYSSVLALSHVTVIRMTLLQFLENYRIFGSFDIAKQICHEQNQLRSNLNQKRSTIMNSQEFIGLNSNVEDNQHFFSERSKYVGQSRKNLIATLAPQISNHSGMRINSQIQIDPQIGAYLLNSNTQRDTYTQNKSENINPKLLTEHTQASNPNHQQSNIMSDRFKGLIPEEKLRVCETNQSKHLTGQRRKITQMIELMGLRVDSNSPQQRVLNNSKNQTIHKYFNLINQERSKSWIKIPIKSSVMIDTQNFQELSPFKSEQIKINELADTSIILKAVKINKSKDTSSIQKVVRLNEKKDTSFMLRTVRLRSQASEQYSPMKVSQREALFQIVKLKTQPPMIQQTQLIQSQQTLQQCPQHQPYQFNQSYLSDQRSKLYKSWRKNGQSDPKFQKIHYRLNE